ncbi:MAG TPA: hypothetical protein VFC99_22065 [Acidimicrobiia bacterium]|nr:hypothetical protein [Acidimicrobiia bacterium]
MGTQRTTFDKLQRERAKKAKAAEKRERRRQRDQEAADAVPTSHDGQELSAAELLVLIEDLHKRFDAKLISFEDFEEQKADLFGRLAALPIE